VSSEAFFLPFGILNHSLMLVKLANMSKRKVPFKYFDFLVDHPQFQQTVAKAWEEEVTGTPMFILCKKLKRVKGVLRDFNKKFFSKILNRVLLAWKAMKDV